MALNITQAELTDRINAAVNSDLQHAQQQQTAAINTAVAAIPPPPAIDYQAIGTAVATDLAANPAPPAPAPPVVPAQPPAASHNLLERTREEG